MEVSSHFVPGEQQKQSRRDLAWNFFWLDRKVPRARFYLEFLQISCAVRALLGLLQSIINKGRRGYRELNFEIPVGKKQKKQEGDDGEK